MDITTTRTSNAQWTRLVAEFEGTALDRHILERDTTADTQAKVAKYPIGRFGWTEEIAQASLFLASDEASFVSGTAFCVDGGMTAI